MATMKKINVLNLQGKVAIVSGGSRGIGRECCLALARAGCNVAVAAKSTVSTDNLPGTIFTVAKECEEAGKMYHSQAMGLKCDLRKVEDINAAVEAVVAQWGRYTQTHMCVCFNMRFKYDESSAKTALNSVKPTLLPCAHTYKLNRLCFDMLQHRKIVNFVG